MTLRARSLAAALIAIGVAAPAAAAEVQVYVTSPDGRPAPDTVVVVLPTSPVDAAATPSPAELPVIAQKDIRFQPYVTAVPLGTTVRFVNQDRFDHHVRSMPGGPLGSIAAAKEFEFRLAAARGNVEPSAELKMDSPGAIAIGCHLHGSMRGHIYVSPTPWVAVTNAAGRAVITGVPAGTVDVRLWHPDQLLAQNQQRIAVTGAPIAVDAKLNFSPRRRTPPPPVRDYGYN